MERTSYVVTVEASGTTPSASDLGDLLARSLDGYGEVNDLGTVAEVTVRLGSADPHDRWAVKPGKPWRVSWGFGPHEDFATSEEAQAKYDSLPGRVLPNEPYRVT